MNELKIGKRICTKTREGSRGEISILKTEPEIEPTKHPGHGSFGSTGSSHG